MAYQNFVETARGTSILGYSATESLAALLMATKISSKAVLPGGHSVLMVDDARWETFFLKSGQASIAQEAQLSPSMKGLGMAMGMGSSSSGPSSTMSASEQEYWRSLQQHSISGSHYYCETADITRPFPSSCPSCDPDPEFVWNTWLSQPFKALGLITHCPALLQGAVESADEIHPTGQRYTMALISRRSRRHPGTRYIARGLNNSAGPGNEIEAELVCWTPSAGSSNSVNKQPLEWFRVLWRRGTVPIWWGVELQPLNKGLQAEVYIRDVGPYVGMLTYFRSLQKLTTDLAGKDAASPTASPVTCINLLHCNPKKAAELMLSSHFQQGMRHVREHMASGNAATSSLPPPRLLNFDWHGTMGSLTEDRGIEAFWHFIEQPIRQAGFSRGVMEPISTAATANGKVTSTGTPTMDVTPWGDDWQMRLLQRQQGLLRFNCADSLDRTNAATCFAMLPVLTEGLRSLGIKLDVAASGNSPSVNQEDEYVLPPGWEVRNYEGRAVYVDHLRRVTQWDPPAGAKKRSGSNCSNRSGGGATAGNPKLIPQWSFFSYSLAEVRVRLYHEALVDYVTMFRKHGDVHSALYTGSPAMHSHVLGLILAAEVRPYGTGMGVGRLQNLRVAVQRRWNNTVSDFARQQSMELFLGLNIQRHCPGLALGSPSTGADRMESTLSGLDSDDLLPLEWESQAYLGAGLSKLNLSHHNGRIGVSVGDASTLEPLSEDISQEKPPPPQKSDEDEDVIKTSEISRSSAMDPLGAVKFDANDNDPAPENTSDKQEAPCRDLLL